MYRFDFSYAEYQRFLEHCPFTPQEKQIINFRRLGESNVSIMLKLNISERTLNRRIHSIMKKISKEI